MRRPARCGGSQGDGSASQGAYPVGSATRRVAVPGVATGRTPPHAALAARPFSLRMGGVVQGP
ncbi:hypothetical protein DDQ41_24015 [Streptomyces spongiicola]|uniref:Uncharacterized protein n=1 Tax=Streptomyces spongiicola TaxID=1690221 RepID=A0ABN5KY92_9ACTN|nr:hypothetical protein DDQ41_24015 [Streptomyces spongiicola]